MTDQPRPMTATPPVDAQPVEPLPVTTLRLVVTQLRENGYHDWPDLLERDVLPALDAARAGDGLNAAWAQAVAITPKGWLFHGVDLIDNSMDGGSWGPGWETAITWPGHCQYDDCDHDEAFRVGKGATPVAALRDLIDGHDWTALPAPYEQVGFALHAAAAEPRA